MSQKAIFLTVGLCCVFCLAGSAATDGSGGRQRADKTDPERNKARARRWIEEGFNKRDLRIVEELFAEKFVVNGQRVGPGGVRQSMNRFLTAFPDLRVTVTDAIAEGEKVGLWYTVQATHKGEFGGVQPTEKPVKWSGVDLFLFAGGRIVEARFLDDSLGLLRQLGAVSSPETTGPVTPLRSPRLDP